MTQEDFKMDAPVKVTDCNEQEINGTLVGISKDQSGNILATVRYMTPQDGTFPLEKIDMSNPTVQA